jgi:hypothetical protein
MPFVSSREVEEFTLIIKDLLLQADELEKVVSNLKNENNDLKKENESLKFQLDNENEIDFLNSKIKELNKRVLELEEDLKFERREKVKLLTKLFELE